MAMKFNPLYLVALGIGGLALMGSSGQNSDSIQLKAGETWQITIKGVNMVMDQARLDMVKKEMVARGYATSIVPSADMTTATMTVTPPVNETVFLNNLMPNNADPTKGIIYVAAVKLSPQGPVAAMGSPADVSCVARGGRVEIVNEPGGQRSYCVLPDGSKFDAWALFRGEVGPRASSFTMPDSGKTVTSTVGQTFAVELPNDDGFGWDVLASKFDNNIIRLVSAGHSAKPTGAIAQPRGTTKWTFEAKAQGTTRLDFVYGNRPIIPSLPAVLKTFNLMVNVVPA